MKSHLRGIVAAATHYAIGESAILCGTRTWWHATAVWKDVTCRRCLDTAEGRRHAPKAAAGRKRMMRT